MNFSEGQLLRTNLPYRYDFAERYETPEDIFSSWVSAFLDRKNLLYFDDNATEALKTHERFKIFEPTRNNAFSGLLEAGTIIFLYAYENRTLNDEESLFFYRHLVKYYGTREEPRIEIFGFQTAEPLRQYIYIRSPGLYNNGSYPFRNAEAYQRRIG